MLQKNDDENYKRYIFISLLTVTKDCFFVVVFVGGCIKV